MCGCVLVIDIANTLPTIYLLKQHVRYLFDLVDKSYRAFSSLMCGRVLLVDIVDTLPTIYLLKQHVRYLRKRCLPPHSSDGRQPSP